MTATLERPPAQPQPDERVARVGLARRLLVKPEFGALVGVIVIFVFFSFESDVFRSMEGAANWLDGASTVGLMAVPISLLMIGGHFDLSAGVQVGTAGLATGIMTTYWGLNVYASLVVSLLLVAGHRIHQRVPGDPHRAAQLHHHAGHVPRPAGHQPGRDQTGHQHGAGQQSRPGAWISRVEGHLRQPDLDRWPEVPDRDPVVDRLHHHRLVAAAQTRFGNWIFATGGEPNASKNVGVPTARTTISLFMMTSAMAWFVGNTQIIRFSTIQAQVGIGQELIYIVAAVIGGCLLTGGYGSVIGASLGALIFGMTQSGIVYANWNSDWFKTFVGAMLLLAVLANQFVRRLAEQSRRR